MIQYDPYGNERIQYLFLITKKSHTQSQSFIKQQP